MDIGIIEAANAYRNASGQGKVGGGGVADVSDGLSFQDFMKNALEGSVDAAAKSETTSMQAITGQADLIDVVTAVANAELAVETVVAIRDRVIQAYNEIIRMPI